MITEPSIGFAAKLLCIPCYERWPLSLLPVSTYPISAYPFPAFKSAPLVAPIPSTFPMLSFNSPASLGSEPVSYFRAMWTTAKAKANTLVATLSREPKSRVDGFRLDGRAEGGPNLEGFGADPLMTGDVVYETVLGWQEGRAHMQVKHYSNKHVLHEFPT
ncbi:hypothetical protein GSI_13321 [Ganoderma sinense ZZ0214-1]|uniref:Uncharacterized protein n=1 Tax=Ganoderma sinense ZZ0214-1 TaxID=1077348 RepID=A0A2G8RV95_9APHY|nr:hypothetical protein GSI_13321 [Ganoderma sinense ZZ0214-1]